MKYGKRIVAALLSLGLCLAAAGCIPALCIDKDRALDAYNAVLQWAGTAALTGDRNLRGERTFGADEYVGTYEADYTDFTGREYLFGNTGIERENGKTVTVVCAFAGTDGTAKLCWTEGEKAPVTLFTGPGSYETTLEVPAGSGYLWIEGDGYTGSAALSVFDKAADEA